MKINKLKTKLTILMSILVVLFCLAIGNTAFASMDIDNATIEEITTEEITTEEITTEEQFPETDILIDETVFPDQGFRQYVADILDLDQDGVLSETEIDRCKEIIIDNSKGKYNISDLTGIEIFSNLETLSCNYNQLISLDVSKNEELIFLDCSDNKLTSLDISSNTKLKSLYCWNNLIMSIDVSQNKELSNYVLLNTPTVNTPYDHATNISISWSESIGADGYYIYRRTKGGSWKKIASVTGEKTLSYTDHTAFGPDYEYTIKGYYTQGTETVFSSYDKNGKSVQYVATPKLSDVSNVDGGIKISWGKVTGAEKYRVYYKIGTGKWTMIADTTSTSYTWKGAKSATTYTFTVRCLTKDSKGYASDFDKKGSTLRYIAAPKLSEVTNVNGGVKISWGKVDGAAKYRIYYKIGTGKWTKIADTTSTTYTWKDAKSGTDYTYTVRCVSSDGKSYTSGYDSKGISLKYVSTPKISSVTNVNGGVKISWGKIAGADKYRVYYRIGNGKWIKITSTTSTSYTWKGAKSGTNYAFTVRCVSSDEKTYTSSYDNIGVSLKYIAAPQISSVTNVNGGVKITWGKVVGAAKYRVFYKTGTGNWTRIASTTATSYTWTGAKSGTTYSFTVRCVSSDEKSYTSSYDSKGVNLKYIAAPIISSVSSVSGGTKITWNKVTGAAKYRVYYKTGSGSWTRIADTTATSYTWTGAKNGNTYRFTVRCISSDGKSHTSGYDPVGKSLNDLLVLVNPTHYKPDDWTLDLVSIGGGHSIDRRAYNDLQNMLNDCRAAGKRPYICSSYRTYDTQVYLYNNKVSRLMNQGYSREQAKVEAARWVAKPGTSEHELGLALDIVDSSYQTLNAQQEKTATQIWLMNNSYKYGFILRYPTNKSNITGIGYEPWHYRYVGKEAAAYIYQNGLCLEEYLESR